MITKEDVIWLNDEEITLWEEDNWAITYHRDFFNEREWFEIRCPDGTDTGENYGNIYDAIDAFNLWKEISEV